MASLADRIKARYLEDEAVPADAVIEKSEAKRS